MGVVMWTLIGRFAMGLFLPEDSTFFFMKFFVKSTYVAWFFFMVRFYLMPWLLGYSVMGMLSFPLESEFARGVANLVGYFAK
jgi:hypothetical protein